MNFLVYITSWQVRYSIVYLKYVVSTFPASTLILKSCLHLMSSTSLRTYFRFGIQPVL